MQKRTGLLLGAGASYEAGMPLVWELTKELKDWLTADKFRGFNKSWKTQGGGVSNTVVENFISVWQRNDMHYEAILGYLETQAKRQRNDAQEYHYLYIWLIQMVYFILYYRHINKREFLRKNLGLYEGFKSLVESNGTLWVFSLNHDVITEAVAERFGIPLFTGFGPTQIELPCYGDDGEISENIQADFLSGEDLSNRKMNYPNPVEEGIYLLKIHGALDQFAINDGKDFIRLAPSETYDAIAVLQNANEKLNYYQGGVKSPQLQVLNEIVYTDKDREMQFMRRSILSGAHKFGQNSAHVVPESMLAVFKHNIGYVTNLICIGYGLADQHINIIVRSWLERSEGHCLEIVDPHITSIPDFLLHVAPQVELTQLGATDFFDRQAGIERTDTEVLEKELASKIRGGRKGLFSEIVERIIEKGENNSINNLAETLSSLPKTNDGQPDFSGVKFEDLARETTNILNASYENILREMLAELENDKKEG